MQFNIKYSRMGNKFFFVSNLTEWHFSCRKNYNEVWLNKIGDLSKKEKNSLEQFKKILQKYNFANYLGLFFITSKEKKVWKNLSKIVTKTELGELKEIFDIFEDKFKEIWNSQILEKNIKILTKEINKTLPKIINALETLFGKIRRRKFDIYLLQHPYKNKIVSGGANLKNKGITIECNDLSETGKEILNNAISVVYHEFLHMLFGKKIRIISSHFYEENGKSKIIPYRDLRNTMEEIVVHSLFSYHGFLSNKYFYKHPKETTSSNLKKYKNTFISVKNNKSNITRNDEIGVYFFIAINLHPLIKEYLNDNKKIDKHFISEIIKIIR